MATPQSVSRTMSPRRLRLVVLLGWLSMWAGVATASQPPSTAPVVTIDPACPLLPRPPVRAGETATTPVTVTYDPSAPGARITAPASLSVELGFNWGGNSRTLPMAHQDNGTWRATIPVARDWNFVLFYVRDERQRVDDHAGQYWEVLACDTDGWPTLNAVQDQAGSFAGRQLREGILREIDYRRAIALLEEDRTRHPGQARGLFQIWRYRAKLGGETPAAYAQLATEIDSFVAQHQTNLAAVVTAAQFASTYRTRLPRETLDRARAALAAVAPESGFLQEILLDDAQKETDPRTRAALLGQFVERYPKSDFTQSALAERFRTLASLNDIDGTEQAFEAWRRFVGDVADVHAALGRFYVQRGVKPDRAAELLTKAIGLCAAPTQGGARSPVGEVLVVACEPPRSGSSPSDVARYQKDLAWLRFYRGRALTQAGQPAAAIDDLQASTLVLDDEVAVAFALGKAGEKAGRNDVAYGAYLKAASMPHQATSEPYDALVRVSLATGNGTLADVDARLMASINSARKKVASDFTPTPIDQQSPAFELQTLDRKSVTNASLRGRPAVLTFWATWCGPCIAEMPGFVELQRRHPDLGVIAIAIKSELAEVRKMAEQRKWTTLTVALSDSAGLAFGVEAVPRTYLLDKDGRLRFVHTGGLDDVVAVVEKELALMRPEKK